ncbi:hypothetical protein AVEN_268961-1 [Araneus ventricosus]|uniref:Uncharacterized protein n=1 Tax=Araneus ventricosus TaxID=182803 RepID=A0A4Y2I284_ARAVE|nr:hypothetical protein AVEN_268961-1 [Araneus ventricosus]
MRDLHVGRRLRAAALRNIEARNGTIALLHFLLTALLCIVVCIFSRPLSSHSLWLLVVKVSTSKLETRFHRIPTLHVRPRWPSGKVSASKLQTSRFETRFHLTSIRHAGLLHVKSYVGGNVRPLLWCGSLEGRCQLRRRPRHLTVAVPK